MATEIVWSQRAQTNLQNIFDYISKDSVIYARRFVSSLVLYTEEELQDYLNIGRRVPEFINTPLGDLREIIYKGYRIIYYP